jgi:hypothetical protein
MSIWLFNPLVFKYSLQWDCWLLIVWLHLNIIFIIKKKLNDLKYNINNLNNCLLGLSLYTPSDAPSLLAWDNVLIVE